jgi:hypothetical protein
LGSITTIEDRCIVFPNIYQHKVSSFQLSNSSNTGNRKILAFFLINPEKTIVSTKYVSPQQKDWFDDCLLQYRVFGKKFPKDAIQHITSYIHVLSLEEAKLHRTIFMKERSNNEKQINMKMKEEKYYFDDPEKHYSYFQGKYNFCEH